ncbi:rhodopsin-like [Eriocheir sinensis]|uniref:rhodopsin-like n=1 Tax=Eriocheir sinensis TaxID=95602 RepID=UPI0021C8C167|nr:rhodopsin-like [Eriocheir sinensis]
MIHVQVQGTRHRQFPKGKAGKGDVTCLEMAGNCTMIWILDPGYIPDALLHFFLVYCCFICIVGITCNVVALWCVVRCPRSFTPVKVILCAIFSCMLLTCLFVVSFMAYLTLAMLRCDREVSRTVQRGVFAISNILFQMELFYTSVMALLRARAVWAPRQGPVRLSTTVAVVVGIGLYNSVTVVVVRALIWTKVIHNHSRYALLIIFYAVNFFLPVLLTLACYLSTIAAVRRNRRNLAGGQPMRAVTRVMDEATRAMLAVFISNLIIGLPFTIYLLTMNFKNFKIVPMIMVYYTHLFVDPLVFVCFNKHHRRRVQQVLKLCLGRLPREEGASTLESQAVQSSSALGFPTRGEAEPRENTY